MIRTLRIPVLLLALGFGLAGRALAQDPPMGEMHREGADHEAMMARHEAMKAEMQAADERLESLVAAMNAAEGDDARIDAMAALLTELVAQRKGMCRHMMEGMHGMMQGMHEGMMGGHEQHRGHEGHPGQEKPPRGQPQGR
jgi:hypothetical protein